MEENKENRGGIRPGAGRPPSKNSRGNSMTFRFTDQTKDLLNIFKQGTGLSVTSLVEDAIFAYLNDEENVISCPKCGMPVGFRDKIHIEGEALFKCIKCENEFSLEI